MELLTVYLDFSLAARSSVAKQQTINKIKQSLQPYHFETVMEEGRFVVKLSTPNWPDGVFQLLDFAQQLGRHFQQQDMHQRRGCRKHDV
ncbi:Uncharacterised protein [Helicobacter pametensis]|nr:Uncharacterised protein [Helicobacter pametensis]